MEGDALQVIRVSYESSELGGLAYKKIPNPNKDKKRYKLK